MHKLRAIVIIYLVSMNSVLASQAKDRNCGKYQEDWRIANCAASLKQAGLITKHVFNNYMNMAILAGEPTTQYYSIGFTTGVENKLVAGVINDPVLASGMAVNYAPNRIYFERKLIDLGKHFDKPIALYTTNEMEDIPEWNPDFMGGYQPKGSNEIYAVYKAEGSGKIDINGKENCGYHDNWVNQHLIQKPKQTAIWFGQSNWCPALKEGVMEIVVAEVEAIEYLEVDGTKTKMYTLQSAVWRDGSFGNPTKEMQSVFQ